MIDYLLLENELNKYANKILMLIKEDYEKYMSNEVRERFNELLNKERIVQVNNGANIWNDKTLAHGGRALNDGIIHFYPDVRNFASTDVAIEICKKILSHEVFHYFIQPDRNISKKDREIASFYVEGLVERETRNFAQRHPREIIIEDANYGYNINFVNLIQERMNASSYRTIFSDKQYLEGCEIYDKEYREVLNTRTTDIDVIRREIEMLPISGEMKDRLINASRKLILQKGNTIETKRRLDELKRAREQETNSQIMYE